MFKGQKPTKKNLFFIYGSARKGMYNHSFLEDSVKFKSYAVLEGFKLYSLRQYPAVLKSDNSQDVVVGEIYEFIKDEKLNIFDNMEIVAGYKRIYTKVKDEHNKEIDIVLYEFGYPNFLEGRDNIESGDWIKFKTGVDK